MKNLVSVLMPSYNSARYLGETVECVLNQTWGNKELIIVDDGSTDGSLEIAKSYESRYVRVFSQKNAGASVARNFALSEAQGDFIQYLDADDLLSHRKIEIQMDRLLAGEEGLIASGAWGRFFATPGETRFETEDVWADLSPVDWLITSWRGGGMMPCHGWLIPRAVAEKAGKWDETPCPNDDGEYFARVVLASRGVVFCGEAKAYYRSGIAGSWSGKRNRRMLEATYRSLLLCTEHLLNAEDSDRTRRACTANLQRFIYSLYPDLPTLVKEAEAKIAMLGGSDLQPGGGRVYQLIATMAGWKAAKKLQMGYHRIRHELNPSN